MQEYFDDKYYGIQTDKPGFCFAFIIDGDETSGYKVEIQMNDQIFDRRKAIPYMQLPSAEPLVRQPDDESYSLWTDEGFSYLQNWIANVILRDKVSGKDGK